MLPGELGLGSFDAVVDLACFLFPILWSWASLEPAGAKAQGCWVFWTTGRCFGGREECFCGDFEWSVPKPRSTRLGRRCDELTQSGPLSVLRCPHSAAPPPLLLKCRHINYESLEAYLCVECGYCAYAHFGFRLTAAVETDFAPVTNEVRPPTM